MLLDIILPSLITSIGWGISPIYEKKALFYLPPFMSVAIFGIFYGIFGIIILACLHIWNPEIIQKNKKDVCRVQRVKEITCSDSISELSFSLFPMLSKILSGLIIGPLSIEELKDSTKYYRLSEQYIPNSSLLSLLTEYDPKLKKILNY